MIPNLLAFKLHNNNVNRKKVSRVKNENKDTIPRLLLLTHTRRALKQKISRQNIHDIKENTKIKHTVLWGKKQVHKCMFLKPLGETWRCLPPALLYPHNNNKSSLFHYKLLVQFLQQNISEHMQSNCGTFMLITYQNKLSEIHDQHYFLIYSFKTGTCSKKQLQRSSIHIGTFSSFLLLFFPFSLREE